MCRVLLCGIGKLENNYIREWVEYHKNLGFNNIVLYDNNDIDGEHFEDVIGDYIESGYVILKNWRGKELAQIPSYNSCYHEYKDKYDWICFWDIDEFIEFDKSKTIQEFVSQKKFDKAKCIRIGWKQFTDNNLLTVKNNNYSINRFTEVFDKKFCLENKIPVQHAIISNTQAKSIIRTNIKDFKVTSPHCFLNVPTVNAVGEKCRIAIKLGDIPVWKGAWLNHYRFKTIEEYVTKKMVRLWPTKYMNGGKDRLDLNYFFMHNKKTKEKVDFAKRLKIDCNENLIKINTWTQRDNNGKLINNNWGDDINFYFLQKLFDKKLVDYQETGRENYTFIGSILTSNFIDSNSIVWGAGIQIPNTKWDESPKKVCAVRGPLTREFLLKKGIECPEIYGDPSLLLPYYYYPIVEKKYKIGLIPHWSSLNSSIVKSFSQKKGVHVIKMSGYNNWLQVIDEILSCDYIISESLHGIIMAEAYGVPNLWVDITLKNIFDIKFHDFFQSIGLDRNKAVKMDKFFTIEKAMKYLQEYKAGTMVDLNALVDACPIEITNKEFLDRVKNNKIVKTNKIKMDNVYESGVSICITAYKAKKFIKECLDSVEAQTWFNTHDNWEVLLGIDGCEETLEYVKTIMNKYRNLRVFMMAENKGTYITTNTIMSLAKYDGLIRFDADDVMLTEMVETIMKKKGDAEFVNFKMKNFGRSTSTQIAGGQMYVKHDVFDYLGGYRPWSCSADTDFEVRAKKFFKHIKIDKVLFRRRIHDTNLTVAKETNFRSKIRKENLNFVNKVTMKLKKKEEAVIKKVTNSYYEIDTDFNYAYNGNEDVYNDIDVSGETIQAPVNTTLNVLVEKQNEAKTKALELLNKNKVKEEPTKAEKIFETKKEENKVRVKTVKVDKQPKMLDPRFDSNW